jgi:hypothetical protein
MLHEVKHGSEATVTHESGKARNMSKKPRKREIIDISETDNPLQAENGESNTDSNNHSGEATATSEVRSDHIKKKRKLNNGKKIPNTPIRIIDENDCLVEPTSRECYLENNTQGNIDNLAYSKTLSGTYKRVNRVNLGQFINQLIDVGGAHIASSPQSEDDPSFARTNVGGAHIASSPQSEDDPIIAWTSRQTHDNQSKEAKLNLSNTAEKTKYHTEKFPNTQNPQLIQITNRQYDQNQKTNHTTNHENARTKTHDFGKAESMRAEPARRGEATMLHFANHDEACAGAHDSQSEVPFIGSNQEPPRSSMMRSEPACHSNESTTTTATPRRPSFARIIFNNHNLLNNIPKEEISLEIIEKIKEKICSPDDAWNLLPVTLKIEILNRFIIEQEEDAKGKELTSIICSFPKEILYKIFYRLSRAYNTLRMTCKNFLILPSCNILYNDFVMQEINLGCMDIGPFIGHLLFKLNKAFPNRNHHVKKRKVFDEKCRYITISSGTHGNRSDNLDFRIDKDTFMIIGNEVKPKPRQYVTMENPECLFNDKESKLYTIKQLINNIDLEWATKEYFEELSDKYTKKTESLKKMTSHQKKKSRASNWNESNIHSFTTIERKNQ